MPLIAQTCRILVNFNIRLLVLDCSPLFGSSVSLSTLLTYSFFGLRVLTYKIRIKTLYRVVVRIESRH